MPTQSTFPYLLSAISLVLFLWVIAASSLVLVMRRQLKDITAERDDSIAQLAKLRALQGKQAKIKTGPHQDKIGTVITLVGDEVCLQMEDKQLSLHLQDVELLI